MMVSRSPPGSSPRGRGKQCAADLVGGVDGLIPARAGKTSEANRPGETLSAHPRAGGENSKLQAALNRETGSSPRGRGKLGVCAIGARVCGLIPARAGKTDCGVQFPGRAAAHPRAGGENRGLSRKRRRLHGSSPRGRGKLRRLAPSRALIRLIPARAGKTGTGGSRSVSPRAHPRAGGENACEASERRGQVGSSPRGRGKPTHALATGFKRRLIPARAGKTIECRPEASDEEAHPRAGGENRDDERGERVCHGSSPRGRGKLRSRAAALRASRLIPARAGKTGAGAGVGVRAHPRAGGENPAAQEAASLTRGSSPRGRGKRCRRRRPPTRRGLIPARAGKTIGRDGVSDVKRAHPRAGGENMFYETELADARGSSPRGRGKLECGLTVLGGERLIPARAGKTPERAATRQCAWAHPRAGGENAIRAETVDGLRGSSPRGRGKRPADSQRPQ